jgi:hypothetical protein
VSAEAPEAVEEPVAQAPDVGGKGVLPLLGEARQRRSPLGEIGRRAHRR